MSIILIVSLVAVTIAFGICAQAAASCARELASEKRRRNAAEEIHRLQQRETLAGLDELAAQKGVALHIEVRPAEDGLPPQREWTAARMSLREFLESKSDVMTKEQLLQRFGDLKAHVERWKYIHGKYPMPNDISRFISDLEDTVLK